MINLAIIESIITAITLICAYFVSTTLSGAAQAYVTQKMGDSTAKDAGLLSFNPLDHIDAIGLALIIFLGFGWGRQIPVDPYSIKSSYRTARLIFVYFTETLVSLLLAFLSLAILVITFGTYPLVFALQMFFSGNIPLKEVTEIFPHSSSLMIVGAFILMAFVFFNIFIASLSCILNGFRYALVIGFEKKYDYMQYADYLMLLGPMIVFFFFADPLRALFLTIIMKSAYLVGAIIGVA